jgi:stringent starvation protein B
MSMTSNRPYLLRALYEWIVDNNGTPHLVVFAHAEGVLVPQQHVNKDGQIILNIAPSAVKELFITNEGVSFSARFSGMETSIYVPYGAVLGIYGRENGEGMMFEFEATPTPPVPPAPKPPAPKTDGTKPNTPKSNVSTIGAAKRPSLKVVK